AWGSTLASSLPGSVVPPPRRVRRDSRPTARARAISSRRRIRISLVRAAPGPSPTRSGVVAFCPGRSTMICIGRKPAYPAVARIDPNELAAFRAGIRKRYTDEQILEELRACAERTGRSPTMREFGSDPDTSVHPQTVIDHFGSWNRAKRQAGLMPRRFATKD